jgi:hypothetical protein
MDVNPQFFPAPETYRPDGKQTPKEYLLSVKKAWLEFGIARLKQEIRKKTDLKKGQPDETAQRLNSEIEGLNKQVADAEKELGLIQSTKKQDQAERKKILRANVANWINELHKKGLAEAELIGKTTGAESDQHKKNNDHLIETEGEFEKALKDPSITDEWK